MLMKTSCLWELPVKKQLQQDVFFETNGISTPEHPSPMLKEG